MKAVTIIKTENKWKKYYPGEDISMAFNLRNRSFLTLADFNTREMEYLLNLSEDLKKASTLELNNNILRAEHCFNF